MKSLGQKIKQCAGLVDTSDLNQWENGFLRGIVESTAEGKNTTGLSPKQAEAIDRLYEKHFA